MFSNAVDEYESLLKQEKDIDYSINLAACLVAPGMFQRALDNALFNNTKEWEILYNHACAYTEIGHFTDALRILEEVNSIIDKDTELDDEKGLVSAQVGYIYYKMGHINDASTIFKELLRSSDAHLSSLAKNNLLVINQTETPQAIEQLKQCLYEDTKLSALQKLTILLNLALITGKRKKFADYEMAMKDAGKINIYTRRFHIIKATVLSKEKKLSELKEYLLNINEGWAFTLLSKLLLQHNKTEEAISIALQAKSADPSLCTPEFYLTLSSLLHANSQTQEGLSLIEEGARAFPNKDLYIAWADLLIKTKQPDQALSILKDYAVTSQDIEIISKIVIVATLCKDSSLAQEWSKKLPSVNLKNLYSTDTVMSLDEILDTLEFPNLNTKKIIEEKKATETTGKTKKKRKPRYPHGFDPNNTNNPKPDPERWLPKKFRSEFLKKYKKKKNVKGKTGHGAQGAMPESMGQEIGGFSSNPSTAHREAAGERKRKRKR